MQEKDFYGMNLFLKHFPLSPDIIDPAVLRPGRLDKTLYVGLPTMEDRLDILRCITKVKI